MKLKRSQQYILRLCDTPLLAFYFTESPFNEIRTVISWYNEAAVHLLPAGLLHGHRLTGDQFCEWLRARFIPQHRRNARAIYSALCIAPNDLQGIVDACKGLSLNDSYWIAREECKHSFSDINLYNHDFSGEMASLAFTGRLDRPVVLDSFSPEFTTNGALPKAWRIIDGDRVLFKGQSRPFVPGDNSGEQFYEFFASQIAERMGLNCAHYDLADWSGTLCSTCGIFSSQDVSFVPMRQAFEMNRYTDCLGAVFQSCGTEALESLISMFIFDSLIINTDRHLGNFGMLRDNATGVFIGLAPIFDNGRSLAFSINEEGCTLSNLTGESQIASPKWPYMSFDSVAGLLIGEKQKEQLARLERFMLKQHPEHPVTQHRLDTLNGFVQQRVEILLAMPTVNHEQLEETILDEVGVQTSLPEDFEAVLDDEHERQTAK